MHSSLSERLESPKGRSNPKSTLTSWPGIPCTLPGRRWWCLWSSDPAPLPGVPGLQLGRRSCSVQFCTSWGPAPRLWSKQERVLLLHQGKDNLGEFVNVLIIFNYKHLPYAHRLAYHPWNLWELHWEWGSRTLKANEKTPLHSAISTVINLYSINL